MITGATPPGARPAHAALIGLFSLGLGLRLATLAWPYSFFPDEVFQYLDVAHRHVFGYGIVTWEQRYGIRSAAFPLLLAGPMRLGAWLAPDGFGFLHAAKAALALASLAIIWGSYRIGSYQSRTHGLFAGFVAAIWFEFIYFSTQALTEAFALSLFFPAAALLLDQQSHRPARLVLAGALLAAAAVLRFQYGPALILFGAMCCGRDPRRWRATALGAALAGLISIAIDLAQDSPPFGWLFANYHHNIVLGRSYAWTDGPSFYVVALGLFLAPWAGLQILLAWSASRRFPALAAAAITNLIVHSLIAHKEYRYILLSSAILILLAALGTVDFALRSPPDPDPQRRTHALRRYAWAWVGASIVSALNGTNRWSWVTHSAELRAFQSLRTDPTACGVGIYARHWSETGGYSYVHRRLPLYLLDGAGARQRLHQAQPAYNLIMAPRRAAQDLPSAYRPDRCFRTPRDRMEDSCLYRRPGRCTPAAGQEIEFNRWLVRNDV